MQDNPKNRGRRHMLNKSKYNKNKPKAELPKPINKIKSLNPNWDRYEEELTSVNDFVPLGSDFSLLANAPISKGSHFQFKAEANKIQEIEKAIVDTSGLFNIDLNLIALSLSTIPFNERCGIPNDYCTESQRNIMLQTAKNNKKIFEQSLSREGVNISSTIDRYFVSKESINPLMPCKNEKNKILSERSIHKNDRVEHELDAKPQTVGDRVSKLSALESEIGELSVNEELWDSNEKKDPLVESAASILETESLQQWLDDVLGD